MIHKDIMHGGDDTVIEEFRLKNMPELDLWTFLERQADSTYIDAMEETDGLFTKDEQTKPVVAMSNVGDVEDKFIDYVKNNKDSCQHKYFEERVYHSDEIRKYLRLPGTVGYNKNTAEYNWGLRGDSNEQLKELIGGREAFKKMKLDYDHTLARLLLYMPGTNCPWHFDMMDGWATINKHLNPHIVRGPEFIQALKNGESKYDMADKNTCDAGKVVRRIVAITNHQLGHIIQMENEMFPCWNSGDVFDIPPCIWHWSCNAGINIKMTLVVTSFETD